MKIKVNDTELYYEVYGEGHPVIFLHGNGESGKIFKDIPFLLKDYKVYLVDSRGHGQSQKTKSFEYNVMMEDIYQLIKVLGVEKPMLFGFSDGGIVGLMLVMKHPELLMGLMLAGVNYNVSGLKKSFVFLAKLQYFFTRNKKIKMMLKEPDLNISEISTIIIPVLILAGENDVIYNQHTESLANAIAGSQIKIVKKENHSSYIVDNFKLYTEIEFFLNRLPYFGEPKESVTRLI